MAFTKDEIERIQHIFLHLEPRTLHSVQLYTKEQKYRVNATFIVKNKYQKVIQIFQFFHKISPYRLKLIEKRKKEINHPLNVVLMERDYTCIGWKYTKEITSIQK